ncbi:DUF6920 family protein [Azohydromonas aeria]|uniref:DUF6920 family protein n=1 Tax=Azohydromonas aeria TaxID=2590212 RepID=UPI001E5CF5EF|nr:DUF6544 family protein [Azohydromonas aeria]
MLAVTLGLLCIAGAVVLYGQMRWNAGTKELRQQLEAARLDIEPKVFNQAELEGLPAPVQRYFRAAIQDGQPIIAAVNMAHVGSFNMGETTDNWKPFKSTQRVITRRPGFDWDVRVSMLPGMAVHVHDAYVAGEGVLHAAIFGLIPVVNLRGPGPVAQGELMRFLAEAAWYPTALLPSQGVRWQAVDDRSARATLSDGSLLLTLLFRFNSDGLVEMVRAEARGRTVGRTIVPTPWQGRFWNYVSQEGMRVPLEGEVAWLLPEGEKTYWRGKVTAIHYEFARQ